MQREARGEVSEVAKLREAGAQKARSWRQADDRVILFHLFLSVFETSGKRPSRKT